MFIPGASRSLAHSLSLTRSRAPALACALALSHARALALSRAHRAQSKTSTNLLSLSLGTPPPLTQHTAAKHPAALTHECTGPASTGPRRIATEERGRVSRTATGQPKPIWIELANLYVSLPPQVPRRASPLTTWCPPRPSPSAPSRAPPTS